MLIGYGKRTYRQNLLKDESDLVRFEIKHKESDLLVLAEKELFKEGLAALLRYRRQLEEYIQLNQEFGRSFVPCQAAEGSPEIVKEMAWVAKEAGVGPMAAVAGAIAEFVGRDLLEFSSQVILENGGDIFIHTLKPRQVAVLAGNSPLSGKIGLEIPEGSWGVCTSSGTVGHSISLGQADACLVVSASAALADAFATSIGNLIKTEADIPEAVEWAKNKPGIIGGLIIKNEQMGIWGNIKIIRLKAEGR